MLGMWMLQANLLDQAGDNEPAQAADQKALAYRRFLCPPTQKQQSPCSIAEQGLCVLVTGCAYGYCAYIQSEVVLVISRELNSQLYPLVITLAVE